MKRMTTLETRSTRNVRRFDSLEQEAFLSLWRTYDRLRAFEDELFARYDLTPQQYNALRLFGITAAGIALLNELERPIAECHMRQLGHLSAKKLRDLVALLRAARAPHEPEDGSWR
jgi:hypothetical protein